MREEGFVKSGVSGLDQVLLGGFLRGNVILVEGAAGTGKTLIGTSFVYHGVKRYKEPGIIVVFESTPDKLIRDAAGFGWDLDQLQQKNQLKIVFTSPQVLDQELRSPDSVLLEMRRRSAPAAFSSMAFPCCVRFRLRIIAMGMERAPTVSFCKR
jgi:circadian clock protein KaiC